MLDDSDQRVLADIERRLTESDPVLALLAWRLVAETRRREAASSSVAPGPLATQPARRPGVAVGVAVALVVATGIAAGCWVVVLLGSVCALAAYLGRARATSFL